MRFRTGLLVGLAVGYYYGAKAGRDRYEQIEQWLERLRGTTTYQETRTKLSDGLREATGAARRLVEQAAGGPLIPADPPPGRGADRAGRAGDTDDTIIDRTLT